MAFQFRTVIVKQLPETPDQAQVWAFLEAFRLSLPADRPRIVFNCAGLRTLDRSSLHLLLCCLEEAMKRNGDVRLSALSEPARAVLEVTGIDELFKMFDSDTEAIASFQRLSLLVVSERAVPGFSLSSEVGGGMPIESTENAA